MRDLLQEFFFCHGNVLFIPDCNNYYCLFVIQKLATHIRTCKGKFLYPCVYCRETFISRDEYTEHLTEQHRPRTSFKETGVFIGDSSHKTRTGKDLNPISTERLIIK